MTDAVNIRPARVSDLGKIITLEEICFAEESFTRSQLRYLMTKAKADFWVTEEPGGEISSFIVLLRRKNSSGMRIYSVAVSPGYRGKGLGRLLLAEAEKRAKEAGLNHLRLEVSVLNESAVRLYLNYGFEVFGERPAYYKNGSKALLMRKEVSSREF